MYQCCDKVIRDALTLHVRRMIKSELQHSLKEADRMELDVSLLVSPSSKRERVLTPIATGKAN